MTFKQKVIASWLTGGALALAIANLLIRLEESRAAKPEYVSPDTLEHVLRLASSRGICGEEN